MMLETGSGEVLIPRPGFPALRPMRDESGRGPTLPRPPPSRAS